MERTTASSRNSLPFNYFFFFPRFLSLRDLRPDWKNSNPNLHNNLWRTQWLYAYDTAVVSYSLSLSLFTYEIVQRKWKKGLRCLLLFLSLVVAAVYVQSGPG